MSRLEEIKEEYRDAIRVIGIARKDIDYLIQQAELAEELEKQSHGIELNLLNDEVVRLEQQNQRYKQALEEIKHITRYDDGREEVYNIATKVLEESG